MDLLGRRRSDPAAKARVKDWATEVLELGPTDAVSVTELSCAEPGCPPHETVVLIAREGRPTVQVKVAKPVAEVSRPELQVAIDREGARIA